MNNRLPTMATDGESTQKRRITGGDYHWRVYDMPRFFPHTELRKHVLLFGCGDGSERVRLHDLGYETTALDVRRTAATDLLGDGHQLPFPDRTFDAVLSMQVLEHLHDPWQGVREIARVLKPGGHFSGSVAFMKPYHHSYFHITHLGIITLLRKNDLRPTFIGGAQSYLYATLGTYLAVGPLTLRRFVFGLVDNLVGNARCWLWAMKTGLDPDEATTRFHDDFPLSFRTFDKLRVAPAVVFQAWKNTEQ